MRRKMPALTDTRGNPVPMPSPRIVFALTAVACAGLLGFGYYLEFHDGLEPCPMCIFQRLCFMAIVVVASLGVVHGPLRVGAVVYSALIALGAAVGATIAARQVWLQHLPEDQIPECGPGLEYMLEMYPVADVIRRALDWTFLGLSIAEWSLACFALLLVAHVAFIVYRSIRGPSATWR